MQTIVIMGSGAIGRGYLPWVFSPGDYEYIFVDTNPKLVSLLNNERTYVTKQVRDGKLHTESTSQVPIYPMS